MVIDRGSVRLCSLCGQRRHTLDISIVNYILFRDDFQLTPPNSLGIDYFLILREYTQYPERDLLRDLTPKYIRSNMLRGARPLGIRRRSCAVTVRFYWPGADYQPSRIPFFGP